MDQKILEIYVFYRLAHVVSVHLYFNGGTLAFHVSSNINFFTSIVISEITVNKWMSIPIIGWFHVFFIWPAEDVFHNWLVFNRNAHVYDAQYVNRKSKIPSEFLQPAYMYNAGAHYRQTNQQSQEI